MGPGIGTLDGGKLARYHRVLRDSDRLIRELAPKAVVCSSLFDEETGFRIGAFTYGDSAFGRISRTVCEDPGFVVRSNGLGVSCPQPRMDKGSLGWQKLITSKARCKWQQLLLAPKSFLGGKFSDRESVV